MLSHPPQSGLQARQQHLRQHRRQNSTPTATEAMKIATNSNLPQMHPYQQSQQQQQQRQRMSHRRGMSLDTRRHPMHTPTRQEFPTTPQHVLRETQQQRIARPGHSQQAISNLANDENYLMSPHGTPQMQGFDPNCFDGLPPQQDMNLQFNFYEAQMTMMKRNQGSFSESVASSQDFELYPSSSMSTPTFMNFSDSPNGGQGWISEGETSSSRRHSRRISNGIMDRVSKFENMHPGMEGSQRPLTPPHQNATDYFPMTPSDTPHNRTIKNSRVPQRFAEGYDESMEETIKPVRGNQRSRTTFDEMRQAAEHQPIAPAPARSHTMPMPGSYEAAPVQDNDYLAMGQQMNNGMTIQTQFHGMPRPSHPLSASSDFSHHGSPMTPFMNEFQAPLDLDVKPDLRQLDSVSDCTPGNGSQSTETPPCRISPHRRTESVASIASAASIADIDIEQTKLTTGITMEEIHQYIEGPDPKDNKWVCVFEDCNKRFGRKENIKSHVQTHLNDRQYKCPTCQKCFVRQHDLKRHAKIHTGIKPYPCECGNSFARHDALTRHKQRGMCIGAFDGVVRKVVKRGRPRKHRPDMDERKEKSTRTRQKNMSISSTSSLSGYSDSSAVNSPENVETDFDMMDDIMQDISVGGVTMNPSRLQGAGSSTAAMPTLEIDNAASVHSPSAASIHSYVSQLSHMSLHPEAVTDLPSHPASPTKSISSPYNEPPELSQSSSPPSCNRYFDNEPIAPGHDVMISAGADTSNMANLTGLESSDDDILLQFTHSDPNMLMLGGDSKFDDAFESTVDMFTSNDDLFFGSN
ncbi:Metallothionein expression activator [Apiospora arundinis]|uniref:Metallothionein expression activator n=1 Tax=Apiospora arundinis TaxID=335852 RepID=A0ABR2J7R3_9PEZI